MNPHFIPSVLHLPLTPHYVHVISVGIEAEVLVVQSFEELKRRGSEATGRIVVFNQPFVSYGETVAYREYGASEAAKVGAVATLIRSITPFSINRYLYIYLSLLLFFLIRFNLIHNYRVQYSIWLNEGLINSNMSLPFSLI